MIEKHIYWIDSLKGFGIFLVTFAHLSPEFKIETYIYSFHMFLFFFISGYLYKCNIPLSKYISKKTKSLLVPFILWNILSTLVALIVGEDISSTMLSFLLINGNLCWNNPIWFLLVLYIAEILYATIMTTNNTISSSIVTFISSILILIIWNIFGSINLSLKINLVPLALMCLSLGDLFKKLFNNKYSLKSVPVIAISGSISVAFGAILNSRISYVSGSFGNIYYCIIAGISGSLFFFLLFKTCTFLSKIKFFHKMGENSLIIMCTQYWFFKVFDIISMKVWEISVWHERSTLKALIVAGITIFLIVFSAEYFKKNLKKHRKVSKYASYIGIK